MITLSAGLVHVSPGEDPLTEDVLKEADSARYRGKALGRNRVEHETPVPGSSALSR